MWSTDETVKVAAEVHGLPDSKTSKSRNRTGYDSVYDTYFESLLVLPAILAALRGPLPAASSLVLTTRNKKHDFLSTSAHITELLPCS